LRICYIASTGATGHADRWMRYFADSGHEVHLISSVSTPDASTGNIKLHLLKRFDPHNRMISYLINALPMVIQLKKIISDIKPEVVHAHSVEDTALMGAISGFHPFVVTPWGSDVLVAPRESRMSKWRVKYSLKRADLITCDAEHIKDPLIELGADPQKIKIICFGVDVKKFKPGVIDENLKNELGIFRSPVVMTSRRLDPNCDIASLIKAIPPILSEIPEARFIIIGRGSEEEKLKELASTLNVSEIVRFIGWVPHDELPRYLTLADVYISTALSDAGIAASTAEAMSCGLPVIITDFGDNSKWVQDGVNGFLIPLRAPEVLASRIIYLLKHEDDRKKFGRANRQVIEERNNWEKEMEKMGVLYAELAATK
jgi:glycosyltransferase involved in cell wall biosynthesis